MWAWQIIGMTDPQPSQFLSFCGPARILAAAPFIAILTIVLWLREPVFATPESQLVYGVIVTSFGILWIRSLFFCVRMREGRVKIVSWFRSYSVELQAITAAQPTQYAGMLNWATSTAPAAGPGHCRSNIEPPLV